MRTGKGSAEGRTDLSILARERRRQCEYTEIVKQLRECPPVRIALVIAELYVLLTLNK